LNVSQVAPLLLGLAKEPEGEKAASAAGDESEGTSPVSAASAQQDKKPFLATKKAAVAQTDFFKLDTTTEKLGDSSAVMGKQPSNIEWKLNKELEDVDLIVRHQQLNQQRELPTSSSSDPQANTTGLQAEMG